MKAKEHSVSLPLFLPFARGVGVSRAHLTSVIPTNAALGFGRLAAVVDVFTAHHGLHAALDCFPIGVPGKGSTGHLHSHRNIGSRVSNVSSILWFAAAQPSSLQHIHQQRRPKSTNDLIRLRQKAVVGKVSPSQHMSHQAGLGDIVLATS